MRFKYLPGSGFVLAVMLLTAAESEATIHVVNMMNYYFSPPVTIVRYGDTVRWVDVAGTHTTTSANPLKTWDSGSMTAGGHFDQVFRASDGVGPFPYECSYHYAYYGMVGVVAFDQSLGVNDHSNETVPNTFTLSQNFPNPFNPITTIEYSIPSRSHVVIVIFDILGQQVRTLTDEDRPAGSYQVIWNGTDDRGQAVGSGVYLYRIAAGDFTESRKMLLLK